MSVIISGLYGTLHLTKSTYLINTAHFLKMTRAGQAVLATAASSAGWYRSSNVCAGPAPYHDPRSRTGTMRMAIAVSACSIQHADYASARCTYLPARSVVLDSRSRESCRSGYPDGAICEQMDRQQHDPDQEQNPRNLDRHGGHSGQIQGAGNDSNHQEHQCVVQHIELLSIRRFPQITESSMHPQSTYLILLSRVSGNYRRDSHSPRSLGNHLSCPRHTFSWSVLYDRPSLTHKTILHS